MQSKSICLDVKEEGIEICSSLSISLLDQAPASLRSSSCRGAVRQRAAQGLDSEADAVGAVGELDSKSGEALGRCGAEVGLGG